MPFIEALNIIKEQRKKCHPKIKHQKTLENQYTLCFHLYNIGFHAMSVAICYNPIL